MISTLGIACIFALCFLVEGRALQGTQAVDYYDRLRQDSDTSVQSLNSSNVFVVQDGEGDTYRLADISCFLPLSDEAGVRAQMGDDAFGALLATYHFNNPDKSPILDPADLARLQRALDDGAV